jgi:hypothetical protein
MKYLCMVYYDTESLERVSGREYAALVAEARAYEEELRTRGHYVASDLLLSVPFAAMSRSKRGLFAEEEEQLGGFVVFDAEDLEEAHRLAAKIPSARLGGIDVRPLPAPRSAGERISQARLLPAVVKARKQRAFS